MSAMLARDELIERVNHMSDEQVASLLEFIRVMQDRDASSITRKEAALDTTPIQISLEDFMVAMSHRTLDDYDESQDPMIQGLFSGSPDLASETKTILQEEFGHHKPDRDNESQ
ncbi:MAG: hypothetical protein H6671_12355 [Anaerolineaceae bacterium]|nr:hypothetical protein [Anaerolineaceae bacterium]